MNPRRLLFIHFDSLLPSSHHHPVYIFKRRQCRWQLFSSSKTSALTNAQKNLQFDLSVDLTKSDYTQAIYRDGVPSSKAVREAFEEVYGDPREPQSARFSFDPWYVACGEGKRGASAPLPGDVEHFFDKADPIPGEKDAVAKQTQYCLKRAPCDGLFKEDVFSALIDDITSLGRSIGCSSTTPPWISLYGDGDMQNFHTDAPHGPMAWTLSITLDEDYGSSFQGGETMLLQPRLLDYWREFDGAKGLEAPSIVRYLPPIFGRCVAFDPRVPHGVNRVMGVNDPRHCRAIIHGWFSEPEVVWFGGFEEDDKAREEGASVLDGAMGPLTEKLGSSEIGRVVGFLSVRLDIDSDGNVKDVVAVCDTIVADPNDWQGVVGEDEEGREIFEDGPADLRLSIFETLGGLRFPASGNGGSVVVPFEFV